ncbi:response regulator [Devosia sp.]|jgi:DNA-binding NarL/FixJ family response regulator|uniref:response regulator n=1 Tax=Devosia sp. TaxID=1871048 RepID=UPI0037C1A479
MTKRVVIADDHAFVSWGLSKALTVLDDIEVSICVTNGIEAIAEIRKSKPHLAIIDYNMPGANGLEVFLEAKRWSPETRFILLTGAAPTATLHQFVDAGIHGLCLKDASETEIVEIVRQVLKGQLVVGKSIAALLRAPADHAPVTERELAVLQAIARGHTNASAAASLGISPKTVDSHRTSLMRSFAVNSTASLIVAAMKAGLLDHESLR